MLPEAVEGSIFTLEVTVFHVPYGPTLSWQITCLFFSCSKLVKITDYKWVCLICKFVIESACVPSTNDYFVKNLCNERVTLILDKERCQRTDVL